MRSSRDGGLLRLEWDGSEWWHVSVEVPGFAATARVDPFSPEGERTLSLLFRRMADDSKGWDGARDWSSIEGTFDVSGHPRRARPCRPSRPLRSGLYDEDWRVESVIWLDAGGLTQLAREVAAFESAE